MKNTFLVLIMIFALAAAVSAEEAGMELSVFVPESLYLYGDGSVAVTSGLSTSIGIGEYLEIPIGFDYCKLHGLMVEGAAVDGTAVIATKPWFIADNFLPYIKLRVNISLGPVILSAFGGGAVSWNASLTPLTGYAAADVSADGEYAGFTGFTAKAPFGYGWLAGASVGVNIEPVTISLFGEYRRISSPLTLTAEYLTGPAAGLTTLKTIDGSEASLKMRGFAAGIGGSFAF